MTQCSHWILLCTKNIPFLWIFSKLAHNLVAIEFLTLFKNAKFCFYCSRELLVFGLKNVHSLSKKGVSAKQLVQTFIKIDFSHFLICWSFLGGSQQKQYSFFSIFKPISNIFFSVISTCLFGEIIQDKPTWCNTVYNQKKPIGVTNDR